MSATWLASGLIAAAQPAPAPPFDYNAMLGADDIQGKKGGFLAGKHTYYVGGVFLVWELYENETIGLTHPFYHDLRSRGTGIATHAGEGTENVGTGNDFTGWEWYRTTKVAYGSVIANGLRWENPAPANMYWQPDRLIVKYHLTSTYLAGNFTGWCSNWQEGSSTGVGLNHSFWNGVTHGQCKDLCDRDTVCNQAVYESATDIAHSQCWLGLNRMSDPPTGTSRPGCNPPDCVDTCYAKGEVVPSVNITEEKFISANDVVSTIITSSRPVTLEITGQSFDGGGGSGQIVKLNGNCQYDKAGNAILIHEDGDVMAKVLETPETIVPAKLMLHGMTGVLSASRPIQNATTFPLADKDGVCAYSFNVSLDGQGTTISWTMNDNQEIAEENVKHVLADPANELAAKTEVMTGLLNEVVPYFRCSDEAIVKLYYFLWTVDLMLYTQGTGMQSEPHTQSAPNNFLGMHRYDAVFQILVGSWTSPAVHPFYANGNVLAWEKTMDYMVDGTLPDNFGTTWASGCYGPEAIAHVIGAWQIYEHSGNLTYLNKTYDFYKRLFWDKIDGLHWGYAYDSVLALNKMADTLGFHNDSAHWNETIHMDALDNWLTSQWEKSEPFMFGDTTDGMTWGNLAPTGMSMFPRDWTLAMAQNWMDNPTDGFYGETPLTCVAKKDWPPPPVDPTSPTYNFMVTPDANWYMLRGLYTHTVDGLANKFTVAHLKKYNMEWGDIPVAPETRRMNYEVQGDQYSNFNAGKILLFLEGIGGLSYSAVADTFTFAENLPTSWDWMEFHVPVMKMGSTNVSWVKARSERKQDGTTVQKTVSVENNPFGTLVVAPWAEDGQVSATTPTGAIPDLPAGHVRWAFNGSAASLATVSLTLNVGASPSPAPAWAPAPEMVEDDRSKPEKEMDSIDVVESNA